MKHAAAVAVLSSFVLGMGMSAAAGAQERVSTVTIEDPANGSTTSARWTTVTGAAPTPPEGGWTYVEVRVNGRPAEARVRGNRYRVEIALALGRNQLTAAAEIYGRDEDADPVTVASPTIAVTRVAMPGDGTGTLDRATAYLVTNWSTEAYFLCGEGEGCRTKVRCFRVTSRRIDCPAGAWWSDDPVWRCNFVTTVRLRGVRLYADSYRCKGRMRGYLRRFVRPGVWRTGKRFRVDGLDESPWLRQEVNARNRYGVPRFDVDHDVFLP